MRAEEISDIDLGPEKREIRGDKRELRLPFVGQGRVQALEDN